MPYEQQWDPNVTDDCPPTEEVAATDPSNKGGPPVMTQMPCPYCFGTGKRKVGGYVQVWIEPPPPTQK